MRLILENTGFRNVVEMSEMECLPIPGGAITALPFLGEHMPISMSARNSLIWSRVDNHSFLCAADSCNIEPELYRHVRELVGPVDVLFVGMECDGAPLSWLYGPLLTKRVDRAVDESRSWPAPISRAIDIVKRFGCKQVYVYAMAKNLAEPCNEH